ncbi:hypothetical protein HII36_01470 [Nonomuraea sp. NN258]|uniref:hypothetical protein n=1 Tax=Nonomuraea antri TaxID=2730852 RepID=UPI001568B8CA|nr:hypothetical protein [Nonomuraea antri]NRQ30515.1 hypothetical protein [Nonomuraea antri]
MDEFGPEGRNLWESVTAEFDLPEDKLTLLRRACHTADICARLEAELSVGNTVDIGSKGAAVVNRLITAHRQSSETLARLLRALELVTLDAGGQA